jgi:ABC transporter substrate binding protein (PQQ-dependent alcohol dehydrogenase system)
MQTSKKNIGRKLVRKIAARLLFFVSAIGVMFSPVPATALEVAAAVLRVDYPRIAPISRFDEMVEDSAFAGAALALEDNATTGQFMGITFTVETVAAPPEGAEAALDAILAEGIRLVVILADETDTLRLADRAGPDTLVLNAGSRAVALREAECRANVLHVGPDADMLADAVAQFAVWKQWPRWLVVHGSNPADLAEADSFRRAATKFGARIVEEREFEDTGGSRRSDTGHVQVQAQIPVFMQGAREHDVVIAADASDIFAPYLGYHLWTPRPVMGAGGLRPVTMHPAHEAWGATQFQRRFERLVRRGVQEADFDTWVALRVIGEAAIRTMSADPAALREFALSDEFGLAAFKGQPVTFRSWNGQLRQPILLYDGRITVSVSPQDGFLHQVSPLDSLGRDRPETQCTAFE